MTLFCILSTRDLKTIKMVMISGMFLITPDLSQGLRKGFHNAETVLTVSNESMITRRTEPPHRSERFPLLEKEGTNNSLLSRGVFRKELLTEDSIPEGMRRRGVSEGILSTNPASVQHSQADAQLQLRDWLMPVFGCRVTAKLFLAITKSIHFKRNLVWQSGLTLSSTINLNAVGASPNSHSVLSEPGQTRNWLAGMKQSLFGLEPSHPSPLRGTPLKGRGSDLLPRERCHRMTEGVIVRSSQFLSDQDKSHPSLKGRGK